MCKLIWELYIYTVLPVKFYNRFHTHNHVKKNKGSFWVWAQPMGDDVTMQHCLFQTEPKANLSWKDYSGNISFNNEKIELVREYKYLGNIIRSTTTNKQDIFGLNYTYLRDRANRAMFTVLQRLKSIETPPPEIMFHIFDTLIMPILTYGSDIWGYNKVAITILDKVFLRSVRCTLGIKCTTSNIIVLCECGRMPPSVMCTINTLCFLNRLMCMDGDSLAKQVHDELQHLTDQGFDTWVSSIRKISWHLST